MSKERDLGIFFIFWWSPTFDFFAQNIFSSDSLNITAVLGEDVQRRKSEQDFKFFGGQKFLRFQNILSLDSSICDAHQGVKGGGDEDDKEGDGEEPWGSLKDDEEGNDDEKYHQRWR